jgi:hypothetical protein
MTTLKHASTLDLIEGDGESGPVLSPSGDYKGPWWTAHIIGSEDTAVATEFRRRWEAFDAMKKALEAFADFCDGFDGMHRGLASEDDHDIYAFEGRGGIVRITLGDLRRARAALRLANQECET